MTKFLSWKIVFYSRGLIDIDFFICYNNMSIIILEGDMAEYFTNIVGNDALRRRLAEDILASRLAHAYIIEGREGSGQYIFFRA